MAQVRKIVILLVALLAFGADLQAGPAQSVSVIFSLKQKKYRSDGAGASLSADLSSMVYVGGDRALHVVEIASHKDRVVLTGLGFLDTFMDPSFSPDGKRIVFSLSGGTWYYPSDIYSVQSDGTGVKQLTRSKPIEGGRYAEYFYMPRYSPDGSQISVWQYDLATKTEQPDLASVMSPDGSGLHVLTKGEPLAWADAGKAIFILNEQGVCKYDLASRKTQVVKGLDEVPILGKLRGTDTIAVDSYGWLGLAKVTEAAAGPLRILPLSTTMRLEPVSGTSAAASEDLKLTEVNSDRSGSYLILLYKGDMLEVLQVVKVN